MKRASLLLVLAVALVCGVALALPATCDWQPVPVSLTSFVVTGAAYSPQEQKIVLRSSSNSSCSVTQFSVIDAASGASSAEHVVTINESNCGTANNYDNGLLGAPATQHIFMEASGVYLSIFWQGKSSKLMSSVR